MRTKCLLAVVLFLWCITPSRADTPEALPSTAQKIADQITGDPQINAELYAPVFLKAVPATQMAALCKSLHRTNGPVTGITPNAGNTATDGKFTFRFTDGDMPVTLTLEAAAPHRVAGLWFGPITPHLKSLADLTARLDKLPGQVGFQLQRLDNGQVLAALHPEKPLAIGSTFKLYILATLLKDKQPWDKVIKLEDRYKSLPSGELQNWPAGSPVTVHTLALKMIANSDNTASDHLLALAGPAHVQSLQGDFGLKDAHGDSPFLSTLEMFRLKTDASLRKEFLAADAAGRAALLAKQSGKPAPNPALFDQAKPVAIDQIEWFASPADLCRLMQYFDKTDDATTLAILAVNPGLNIPKDRFTYAGYKGGSEPGVISMTWLLRAKDGKHYALTGTWNDPQKPVFEETFAGLMQAALDLAADSAKTPPAATRP